ncbi:MAG: phosphate/phosphite/phosphonate ABC transporter substrate-binding protein [Proteobacteria bacterium]|nr:phosphate/phosphite/phosphonate ABC transporter substrate-binding protein [Pseudomonadota bacterium]MBU1648438.1 phosphate/phosphite/phosphonate ABC transporter substrate-binding protein [Pseudomonadota bacterium]
MTLKVKQENRGFSRYISYAVLFLLLFIVQNTGASEKQEELLIGIEPEHNIFDQVEKYRLLADYLSRKFDIKIRLTVMSRYGEVLKRFKSRRLDGAFLSSYTATMALKQLNLAPVVSQVNLQNISRCQSYIFVRRDSGIKSVNDMKGKNMVFVDPATTEGYLFPAVLLHKIGITEMNTFFNRYFFAGSHASAIFNVLDGKADIGCAKSTTFNRLTAKDPSMKSELLIVAESQPFPETTLCIRKDLPAELQQKLISVLLAIDASESGREILSKIDMNKFINATESDFDSISSMIDMVAKP